MYIKREFRYEREWRLMQEVLWWSVKHSLHFPGFILFSQSIFFFPVSPIITTPFIPFGYSSKLSLNRPSGILTEINV